MEVVINICVGVVLAKCLKLGNSFVILEVFVFQTKMGEQINGIKFEWSAQKSCVLGRK